MGFLQSSTGIDLTDQSTGLERIKNAGRQILPSILQCDFWNLADEIGRMQAAGIEILHIDVMDGVFVPNISFGMPIVDGIARHVELPMDVHLMIASPAKYAAPMVSAGADLLTLHAEIQDDLTRSIATIKETGVGVGIAINPDTPVSVLAPHINDIDLVLVMSVNAGFGGQSFDPRAIGKIRDVRAMRSDVLIEVDGGIDLETIGPCAQAGCDLFVVGSAITNQDDYGVAIAGLQRAMNSAVAS